MKKRVLFVDDDSGIRYAASFILMRAGCDVSLAADGQRALALLVDAEEKQRPFDLLLTDVQMPRLTGTELIYELKKRGFSLPIIVLTGCADPSVLERLLNYEGVDILYKPYDFQELARIAVAALDQESGQDRAAAVRQAADVCTGG